MAVFFLHKIAQKGKNIEKMNLLGEFYEKI